MVTKKYLKLLIIPMIICACLELCSTRSYARCSQALNQIIELFGKKGQGLSKTDLFSKISERTTHALTFDFVSVDASVWNKAFKIQELTHALSIETDLDKIIQLNKLRYQTFKDLLTEYKVPFSEGFSEDLRTIEILPHEHTFFGQFISLFQELDSTLKFLVTENLLNFEQHGGFVDKKNNRIFVQLGALFSPTQSNEKKFFNRPDSEFWLAILIDFASNQFGLEKKKSTLLSLITNYSQESPTTYLAPGATLRLSVYYNFVTELQKLLEMEQKINKVTLNPSGLDINQSYFSKMGPVFNDFSMNVARHIAEIEAFHENLERKGGHTGILFWTQTGFANYPFEITPTFSSSAEDATAIGIKIDIKTPQPDGTEKPLVAATILQTKQEGPANGKILAILEFEDFKIELPLLNIENPDLVSEIWLQLTKENSPDSADTAIMVHQLKKLVFPQMIQEYFAVERFLKNRLLKAQELQDTFKEFLDLFEKDYKDFILGSKSSGLLKKMAEVIENSLVLSEI